MTVAKMPFFKIRLFHSSSSEEEIKENGHRATSDSRMPELLRCHEKLLAKLLARFGMHQPATSPPGLETEPLQPREVTANNTFPDTSRTMQPLETLSKHGRRMVLLTESNKPRNA